MKPSKYNNKKNYIIALIVIIIITILCLVSCGRRNYQVTLYVDGEKFQSTTVSKNTKIQLPPDPKKEGYTFLGWYINDKKFDDDTLITKDLKLKAKFVKNTYQITFDDGMGGITNVNVKYKEQVNAPADPTRENYIFSGWYLGNEKFDFNSKISSNVKLTARWTRIVANYRVEHYLMNKDGNYNASADEVEILSGQAGSYAKAQTKNYRGYTTPNEQKVIINSNGNTVIKYYYVINQYTLTVVGDNGIEKTFGSGSYFYNDEVNVSYLLKAGYSFANYSEYVSNDIYTMPDSDVTIKVNSIANDDTKYLVEHYKMSVDGDSYLDPIVEEQMGTTDTLITPLVKEFVGFTSPESETVSINGDGSTVVKYYYQRNKYALKLEADKGIASVEGSGDYYFEAEVNVKANVKNGYTFDHWSNNQTDDEYVHIMGAKNETVKAFTSVNTYTITYNLNGGTLDNKIEKYTVESADFDLGSPSKVGYTFTGWLVNNQPSNGTIKQGTYGALNVEATFKPNEDTKYTIEYYFMDVTGEKYVQDEDLTEIKTGTTAQPINYNPKVISGFYTPILKDKNDKEVAITDLIIEPDGSTKLKYYYPRQKLTLNILFENILDPADLEGIDQISEGGSYYYEQKVTINVVVKDGFDFVKWSNNEETNTITYTMTADENQTLIAQIKRHSYTVSFNSKGGSKVKDKSVLFDKLIDEPNEPTRTGHNFDAWYYKDNDNNEIKWNFAENRMPAADITLYAKWIIHKNTVTFDANGGLFENNEDQYDIAGQEVGSLISPIETPTKRGYTFDAWYYKDNENKETKWNFEENKMPDGSLHLYAKWKANTYTVKYNGGSKTSGDMDVTTCTYDKPCKLADNKFERKYKVTYNDNDKTGNSSEQTVEYEFKDWEYNGQNFTDGYSVTNLIDQGTVELTATWQVKEETAALKEVSREGYTFAGWYDESGEVESLVDSLNDISQELNLTAHWTPVKYTIIYNANGGEGAPYSNTYTYDDVKELEENKFTKVGYHFKGWSKSATSNEIITKNKNYYNNTGEITVYAVWEANTYTIKYNGGNKTSGSMDVTTCTYDKPCKLADNKFERKYKVTYNDNDKTGNSSEQTVEYEFKDWEYNGQNFTDGYSVTNLIDQGTVELTATWQVKEETAALKEVSREGYTFAGWYDESGEVESLVDSLNDISQELNLTAHWTPIKYTIIYNANGGEGAPYSNTYIYDDVKELEENKFTKVGYTFQGWSKEQHEEAVEKCTDCITDANNLTNENGGTINLYAVWEANTYTIKYNGGNKTSGSMDVTTCTYDKPCKLADNKFERKYKVTYNDNDKTGNSSEQTVEYEFKDWEYNGQNFTDGYSVTNLIDQGTVELTATWQIKEETTALKEVSREGYTFAGWYDESRQIESLNDISQELNLTAHWTPIKYYVVFDGNGGKDKNGNGTITMEVEFDGENKTLSNEAFTKAYNLIYDFNNGQENFVQPAPIEFKKWLFNGEEYDANVNLGNLTITAGETFTLTAQWGDNPTVTIDEENPTNTNSPAYYKYVFTNWTDGEKDYQKNDSITLTKDITLTAMYNNIQVIPDEYFKAKMTNTRDDVTLTTDSPDNNYKYKYTVDMKKVNNSIINEVDSSKIKSILDNDDVKVNSVILETNDKNTFTIDNSANVDNQVVEFIKSVTKADDVSGKNLSSLYEKYINITINFDPTTVTTTDNTTSTTYRLHYISDYVITQSMLDSMADTGIVPINNSGKKHYKIKRNGHEIRGTYDSGDADVAVACVFSNEACFFGKKPPNGSGGTGMKESLTTYFGKNPQIEKIDILKDNADMTYVASVDSSVTSMGSGELVTFAGNVLYSMGIVSRKPTGNFLGDVALIVSIKTNTTAGKTVKIAVQLKSDYAFADGVDNIFNIKILSPSEYLTYDGIEPGVTG